MSAPLSSAPFKDAFSNFLFLSLICEELDRPRTGDEDEKSDLPGETEKDAAERRKIRGKCI